MEPGELDGMSESASCTGRVIGGRAVAGPVLTDVVAGARATAAAV
jgi:hypothetical protein